MSVNKTHKNAKITFYGGDGSNTVKTVDHGHDINGELVLQVDKDQGSNTYRDPTNQIKTEGSLEVIYHINDQPEPGLVVVRSNNNADTMNIHGYPDESNSFSVVMIDKESTETGEPTRQYTRLTHGVNKTHCNPTASASACKRAFRLVEYVGMSEGLLAIVIGGAKQDHFDVHQTDTKLAVYFQDGDDTMEVGLPNEVDPNPRPDMYFRGENNAIDYAKPTDNGAIVHRAKGNMQTLNVSMGGGSDDVRVYANSGPVVLNGDDHTFAKSPEVGAELLNHNTKLSDRDSFITLVYDQADQAHLTKQLFAKDELNTAKIGVTYLNFEEVHVQFIHDGSTEGTNRAGLAGASVWQNWGRADVIASTTATQLKVESTWQFADTRYVCKVSQSCQRARLSSRSTP